MTEAAGKSGSFTDRDAMRVILPLVFIAMIAVPLVLVLVWGGGGPAYGTALRIIALEAFTLMFASIMTGSQTRVMYRLFKPIRAYRFHIACGVAGFMLALAHGVIVLVERYFRGFSSLWVIGPVVLGMLAVTVFAALDKKRLPRIWRRIHQINYVLFVAIFIKALLIGTDIKSPLGYAVALKALFITYVAAAALAMAFRIRRGEAERRARSSRPARVEDEG